MLKTQTYPGDYHVPKQHPVLISAAAFLLAAGALVGGVTFATRPASAPSATLNEEPRVEMPAPTSTIFAPAMIAIPPSVATPEPAAVQLAPQVVTEAPSRSYTRPAAAGVNPYDDSVPHLDPTPAPSPTTTSIAQPDTPAPVTTSTTPATTSPSLGF